ncbi:hypothetical protein D3C80_1602730 [compost metagenome]
MRLDTATTEKCAIVRFGNRVDALANRAGFGASHEIGGIGRRIRVRHARDHGGDICIVGKMGKGVDVFFVGRTQNEPG